jgi:cell division protein ZapE
MNFLEHYQRILASGEILEDPQQLVAIQKFQTVYDALTAKKSFLSRLARTPIKGLYLSGSVGIGKTFLMDMFYHALPFEDKWRMHFLPFMHEVHAALHNLQGTKNPLQAIAKSWSEKTRIICFDELVINDVADALVLGGLLEAFFTNQICMIFTSNVAPDDLYKNGIQRELFLPTIEKIKHYNEIVHLNMLDDYRTRYPHQAKYYWSPLTTLAQENMEKAFLQFSQGIPHATEPLILYEREIHIKKMAGEVIWFDFLAICSVPRNKDDYLEIVKKFRIVLLSNLSPIRANENDLARCFIQLVDILYDTKTRLIISAALPIEKIYTEGKLLFEFNRTKSRLIQMQSSEWVTPASPLVR